MEITRLAVRDFLGISVANIVPDSPVIMIGGLNGAGKTSLYQAIRLAWMDDLPRVDLKRDAIALLRGSAGKGSISIQTTDGPHAKTFTVTLPARTRSGEEPRKDVTLRCCLDPGHFAKNLTGDERTKLLLQLADVNMDKAAILDRLKRRGILDAVSVELSPLLTLGFDKCAEYAKEQAAQHRGAWKAITGEAYGSVKAKTWRAPAAPTDMPAAPVDYDTAVSEHEAAVRHQESLRSARGRAEEAQARRTADTALSARVEVLRTRVAELMAVANATTPRPNCPCPHCGAIVELVDGKLEVPAEPGATGVHDAAAIAKARTDLDAATRQLRGAEAARDRLAAPGDAAANPSDDDLDQARVVVEETADALRSLNHQREEYSKALAARESALQVQGKADAEHALVVGWEAAQDALSPSGIPSELVSSALGPMRQAIRAACASESVSDWPLPEIAEDGSITAWGRAYALLSESEQYRVDLLLSCAIAGLSKVRLITTDRADMLVPEARGELLAWAMDMTDEGGPLDQVWIFAALKQRYVPPKDEPIEAHWAENGALA
jgi:hypothetical protein